MPFRHLRYAIAALWVLNLVAPALAQSGFYIDTGSADKQQIENNIETNDDTCDPFVDPGCNIPTNPIPPGCIDCIDISEQLRSDEGKIRTIEELNFNGNEIILWKKLTPEYLDSIQLKPEVGY